MKQPSQPSVPIVQTLRGIWVQHWKGRTVICWDPSACDDVSRRAWMGMTADLRRQKEANRERTGKDVRTEDSD